MIEATRVRLEESEKLLSNVEGLHEFFVAQVRRDDQLYSPVPRTGQRL